MPKQVQAFPEAQTMGAVWGELQRRARVLHMSTLSTVELVGPAEGEPGVNEYSVIGSSDPSYRLRDDDAPFTGMIADYRLKGRSREVLSVDYGRMVQARRSNERVPDFLFVRSKGDMLVVKLGFLGVNEAAAFVPASPEVTRDIDAPLATLTTPELSIVNRVVGGIMGAMELVRSDRAAAGVRAPASS